MRWSSTLSSISMLTLAACAVLVGCQGDQGQNEDGGQFKAEIRRTALGVPHIKANNWKGLGYGYGYAQAQDNLCTLADAFLTYRGERSKYFGGDALPPADSTISKPANLDSDFYHRHVFSADVLARMIAAQPGEIQDLATGFAAGYNRYLRDLKAGNNGANAACANAPWLGNISADDVYRRMYAANLAGGYSNFVSAIATAQPPVTPAAAARAAHEARPSTELKAPHLQVGGKNGVGSNMIGFGSAATDDGNPMLFGNPHWYWRGPDRFYQAQLTIPGQINVSGASFLGVPVVLIGFNDNVAWSHTVSAARRFGFYQLTLAPGSNTSYLRDGKVAPMTADTISVDVKQADGSVKPVTRTLYNSQYGPLVDLSGINPALAWGGGTAFAIRDINAANFRSFRNWLRWDRAQSLDEFIRIQKEEAAIPWVNTVAVGKGSAQAWYADIGAVPNVSDAQIANCTTPIGQMVDQVLPLVPFLDGSSSACDWQSDRDSVQPGALGPSRMPSLLRNDYVANMNDSYWSSNPNALLTGYPAIMGPAGTQSLSLRTRMGHVLVQNRLSGSDGYGGKQASVFTVQQMVLNSRVLSAELFKAQALPLVCANPSITVGADPDTGESFTPPITVNVGAACAALAAWGNAGTADARGAHVWDEFWRRAALLPESELYTTQFNPADPIHTPNGISAAAAADLVNAFGAAVLRVQRSPYPENALRSDYLFFTRNNRKLGLFGGCDAQGYFTIDCSDTRLDQGGYTMDKDPSGNSYMQIVTFPQSGVQAYTFLTFSLSDDPASPRFGNYSDRYAARSWLRVPFTEGEIASDSEMKATAISE